MGIPYSVRIHLIFKGFTVSTILCRAATSLMSSPVGVFVMKSEFQPDFRQDSGNIKEYLGGYCLGTGKII